MLKRLLPRTLFGRSLLIIVTPVVLLQIVATYVFHERHWDSVTRRLALGLAGDVAVLMQVLREVPAGAEQTAILAAAEKSMQMRIEYLPDAILPNAHFATIYAKPSGRPTVDTFISEVSQETWIFFPWDTEVQYVEPLADIGSG